MANDLPDWFLGVSRYVRKIGSGNITSHSLPQRQELIASDQSVIVLVGPSTTDVTINAVGSTTSVDLGSQVVKSGDTNRAVTFPAYGTFDPYLNITFAGGDIGTGWWTAASDDQVIDAQRTVNVSVVSGPTALASGQANNNVSATIVQVPNNGQYRIWAISLDVFTSAASTYVEGTVTIGGARACQAIASTNSPGNNGITFPGGFPAGALVNVDVNVGANGQANASIAYSIDA